MANETRELLRRYVQEGSDEAFTRLVELNVALVYSVALRKGAGDVHFAKDISQIVFSDLARKASGFSPELVLAGWLYRHTCLKSAEALRSQHRRRVREQVAVTMNQLSPWEGDQMKEAEAALDEAMQGLDHSDRDALVLRFFRNESLRDIGETFGISEDAAQKRVARAMEKLRVLLGRKGVRCSSAALSAILTAHIASSVPSGLAATLSAAALSTIGGTSAKITIPTLLKIMASTKLKIGIGMLIAGAITTPLILQQRRLDRVFVENAQLRQQLAQKDQEASQVAAERVDADELARLRAEQKELVRLRGQVGALLRETAELRTAGSKAGPKATPVEEKDSAWIEEVLAGTPAQQGSAAGALRGKFLRAEMKQVSSAELKLRDLLVQKSLNNTLEHSPSDFADFQSAYIEGTLGISDSAKTRQIHDAIKATYERAVAEGLDIPSKPTTGTEEWVQRRHQLDRRATEALKKMLTPDEQQMFDTAFLGVMGVDLGGVGIDRSNYPPGFLGPDLPTPSGLSQ